MPAELIREFTPAGEPDTAPLVLLVDFLEGLEREGPSVCWMVTFLVVALRWTGLSPVLDRCARCGRLAPPGRAGRFDVCHGLVCSQLRGRRLGPARSAPGGPHPGFLGRPVARRTRGSDPWLVGLVRFCARSAGT